MATENTHYGAACIGEMLKNCKSIFFIGIGGINMSSLAEISYKRGYRVGGSDRWRTALTERLEKSGIDIEYAHNAENVEGFDAVVYTVAISPDNPEYLKAKEMGIPCISRADYLGYIMTGYKRRIGIAGMHGKSTCTSMCAGIFIDAGVSPTVLSGAECEKMGGAYTLGDGDDFIFEACEYMDSFLDFNPTVAVILNIEMDHVDYFKSMDQILSSYSKFADISGSDGFAVANFDDENVRAALEGYRGAVVSFGIHTKTADFHAENITYRDGRPAFDVLHAGEFFVHVELSVTGEHNIYDALAAIAVSYLSGISPEVIKESLLCFGGAKRRMEYKGSLNGADVFDDYGHHPTEVRMTLDGIARVGYDRVLCVFQPHTYSRTAELIEDFATAFEGADEVIVADIYAARETDTLGMSAELLARRIGEKARYVGGFDAIAGELSENACEGDCVVIMGAGDIYKVFPLLEL